ncbi:MAG: hypothetical protein Q9174_003552, partial [Haloplaca sp. 1 TL-2023]
MDNLWQRRSNSSKNSLSTSTTTKDSSKPENSRSFSASKRFGGDHGSGGKAPINGIAPVTTTGVSSPTSGASSAFGLGSGAFASFGSSTKTPKTPGTAIEGGTPNPTGKEREKDSVQDTRTSNRLSKSSLSSLNGKAGETGSEHPIKHTWIVWYRSPAAKFQDYEKSTVPLAQFSSVESFWTVYSYLKRPSTLPSVSDYHLFKKGIRPVWEDEENRRGGKWIVRLKKGVSDRYWEDLLLAIIGDQFAEAGEEVCGAVLSVRSGEDVLSVWTRIDGGRNIKIRYGSNDQRAPSLSERIQMFGPRPRNTLSGGVPNVNTTKKPSGPQSSGRMLDTNFSIGHNVRASTLEFDQDAFSSRQPPPKRQKLDVPHNSQRTPHVVDGSDDEDQLMAEVVSVRVVPKVLGKPKVNGTQRSSFSESTGSAERKHLLSPSVSAFRTVEDLARSSLSKRRSKNRHRERGHYASATPRSSFASSHSDTSEVIDVDNVQNPIVATKYTGTANLHRKHMKTDGNGHRSPYFLSSKTCGPNKVKPMPDAGEVELPSTSPRLSNQFRDTGGRTRGLQGSISSDELLTADPNPRALSPVKSNRSQSPGKTLCPKPDVHGTQGKSQHNEPGRSNIKPSIFTKPATDGKKLGFLDHQKEYPQEEPAPWNLQVRAYNLRGKTYKDDNIALVYSDSEDTYDIHQDGINRAKEFPELRLRPNKLQKILFAMGGTKMRFQSSKTGTIDNVVDLELYTERDVKTLNAMLQQSRALLVKGEDQEKMDRIFEHKLKESQNSPRTHPPPSLKQPDDLKLAQHRVDRVDRKRASEDQIKADTKRSRVVDLLRSDGNSDGADQGKNGGQLFNRGSKANSKAAERPRPHESDKLGSVLSSMALKYSTRSSAYVPVPALQGKVTRKSSPQPSGDVPKYSQITGLGRRWPASLVFPKEGKKRTTVNFDDLERLDEGEFLNDNLISFYLRYLEVQAEEANAMTSKKVYIFNSFFYERLTDGKNGPKGINYDAVRKWTRDVDIFTYDFVVVPVNEAAHWYLAIICNLPELKRKLGLFEVDELGQGARLDGEDESLGVIENGEVFSSSLPRAPKDEKAELEDITSKREPQDVKEQETATSFAEMSLDAKEDAMKEGSRGLNRPGAFSSDSFDQAMLDSQLRTPVDEVKERSIGYSKRADQREEQHTSSRVVTPAKSSKGGKRKSMPRTFDPYKPTILTFDSFGNPRPATVKVLKQYLREEAKDKRGQMEFDEKELQGVTAKQIPEQNNFSDCGVFLLGYMEAFFANPRDFVDKVMRHELDLESDWVKLDASKIRDRIRGLLQDLERQQREERLRAKGIEKPSKPLGQEHAGVAKVGTRVGPADAVGGNQLAQDNNDDSLLMTTSPEVPHQATKIAPRTRKDALQSAKEIGDISQGEDSKPNVEPTRKTAMEVSHEAPRQSTPIPVEQPP